MLRCKCETYDAISLHQCLGGRNTWRENGFIYFFKDLFEREREHRGVSGGGRGREEEGRRVLSRPHAECRPNSSGPEPKPRVTVPSRHPQEQSGIAFFSCLDTAECQFNPRGHLFCCLCLPEILQSLVVGWMWWLRLPSFLCVIPARPLLWHLLIQTNWTTFSIRIS